MNILKFIFDISVWIIVSHRISIIIHLLPFNGNFTDSHVLMLKWYGKTHLFTYSSAFLGIYYLLGAKGATESTKLKHNLVYIFGLH